MKRLIALLLVSCMLFPLCASAFADTKDVEALMLAANEDEESIKIALDAFYVLTDEEKSQISNEAKESLYKARLYNLANKVGTLGNAALFVADAFVTGCDNVGTEKVSTAIKSIKFFKDADKTPSDYAELYTKAFGQISGKEYTEKDILQLLWVIAWTFYPDAIVKKNGNPVPNQWVSDNTIQGTIILCAEYNRRLDFVNNNKDTISEEVRVFRSEYKSQYSDEVATLNDILIETNLFIKSALNPKGTLAAYKKETEEYRDKLDRFFIVMDSYY